MPVKYGDRCPDSLRSKSWVSNLCTLIFTLTIWGEREINKTAIKNQKNSQGNVSNVKNLEYIGMEGYYIFYF